jgi:hypothetical protein
MSNKNRPKGPFDVKRKILLAPVNDEKLRDALEQLKAIEPVIDLRVDQRGNLRITYDASCVSIRDIESLLDNTHIHRASGLGWRIKSAWYHFLDDNARSNALSRGGACCSRPPPGAGNAGKVRD